MPARDEEVGFEPQTVEALREIRVIVPQLGSQVFDFGQSGLESVRAEEVLDFEEVEVVGELWVGGGGGEEAAEEGEGGVVVASS